MSDLSVKLKKEGKGFLLSVMVGNKIIVSNKEYTSNDLISEQIKVMKMIEDKIKETYPEGHALLNQQLSHVLPMSVMSELRRIRKRLT